eukprot:gene16539-19654_t
MKQILLFILFSWQVAQAQEVLVPYKVHNKFGLSDLGGKMVVQPSYDWIVIGKEYPNGYFGFIKEEQTGVIYNKKEIITVERACDFAVLKDKFIIGKYKEKFDSNKTYASREERNLAKRNPLEIHSLYNLRGQNVYKENFARLMMLDTLGISLKDKKKSKYTLFLSVNAEGKKSVFVFDNEKQLITNWLLKDYEKLNIQRSSSIMTSITQVEFVGKKDWNADEELISFGLTNNEVKKHSKTITKSNNDSGEAISGDLGLYKGSLRGDPSGDIVITGTTAPGSKSNKYYTEFKVEGDKITYQKLDQFYKVLHKDLTLPFKADRVTIEMLNFTLPQSKNGPVYEVHNMLSVESGGKHGVFITDSLYINPVYDELKAVTYELKNEKKLFFLVGLKDKQTNTVKYGTVDIYGKDLRVTKNKKSGYLNVKNEVKLAVEYDEIYKNDLNYLQYKSEFMILKKNGKYGLLKKGFYGDIFVKPVFDKKIGYYIEDYKGRKGLNLYALVDEDAQLFCYASKDGVLYYKAN